jgi:hypothetical protein
MCFEKNTRTRRVTEWNSLAEGTHILCLFTRALLFTVSQSRRSRSGVQKKEFLYSNLSLEILYTKSDQPRASVFVLIVFRGLRGEPSIVNLMVKGYSENDAGQVESELENHKQNYREASLPPLELSGTSI